VIKAPVSEEDQVVTLLGSIPSEYQTVVTALEAEKPGTLTLETVPNALLNEEQKKKVQQALNSASINCSGKALENTNTALHADSHHRPIGQIEMCNTLKEDVIIVIHHNIWLDIAPQELKVNSIQLTIIEIVVVGNNMESGLQVNLTRECLSQKYRLKSVLLMCEKSCMA